MIHQLVLLLDLPDVICIFSKHRDLVCMLKFLKGTLIMNILFCELSKANFFLFLFYVYFIFTYLLVHNVTSRDLFYREKAFMYCNMSFFMFSRMLDLFFYFIRNSTFLNFVLISMLKIKKGFLKVFIYLNYSST